MTTLTIEFPDVLAQKLQTQGVSQEQLKKAIVHFVQLYSSEYDSDQAKTSNGTNGAEFASRLMKNNRELFEELARLWQTIANSWQARLLS